MGEKRKRVEIENGHDGVYPLHGEELTPGCSANNRTAVLYEYDKPDRFGNFITEPAQA